MDTRKRLEKVLTTALGQSFEECPNAKKVVIQQTLDNLILYAEQELQKAA